MPVGQSDGYRMFKHAHTIIPIIDEYDISQGIVSAMVRGFGLKLDGKQVKLGRVIASEQINLGNKKTSAKKHTLHLVMCTDLNDIPEAIATAAEMLGISPDEKVGIILNRRKPNINAVAERIAKIERFKEASVVLM